MYISFFVIRDNSTIVFLRSDRYRSRPKGVSDRFIIFISKVLASPSIQVHNVDASIQEKGFCPSGVHRLFPLESQIFHLQNFANFSYFVQICLNVRMCYYPSRREMLKKRLISHSDMFKLRQNGKYTPVFPTANSYEKIVANVDVKSNGTSAFMWEQRQISLLNSYYRLNMYQDQICIHF